MKLIIQILCFNEAQTLGITLMALPRQVLGFVVVGWLINVCFLFKLSHLMMKLE
jgi:hypothetical protein